MTRADVRRLPRALARTLLCASLCAPAGCFFSTDALPDDAQLACTSADECPGGRECRTLIGLCLPTDGLDGEAPAFDGTPEVTPDVAGPAAEIVVTFTVSEPLADQLVSGASNPLVRLDADDSPPFVLDEDASDERSFVFRGSPAGDEPQGEDVDVLVDLVDVSGNAATRLAAGSLRFDFEPPRLLALATVDDDELTDGETLRVRARLNEPLGEEPAPVVLARAVADDATAIEVPLEEVLGDGTAVFARVVDDELAGGEHGLSLFVADVAGNVAEDLAAPFVVIDRTAPGIERASREYLAAPDNRLPVAVTAVRPGTRVVLEVEADERLDPAFAPALSFVRAGQPATLSISGTSGESLVSFEVTVMTGDASGVYEPSVTWRDLAGNEATVALGVDTHVDVRTDALDLVVAQDDVTYVRSPVGREVDEALSANGGFVLPAGPYFAIAPGDPRDASATLLADTFTFAGGAAPAAVQITFDLAGDVVAADLLPGDDGWPRVELPASLSPRVWAVGLDEAGNRSPAVAIENGELWLHPGPDEDGLEYVEVSASPESRRALTVRPEVSTPPLDLGTSAALATNLLDWQVRSGAGEFPPAASFCTRLVEDRARGVLVHVTESMEVFEWDGSEWERVATQGFPPEARACPALAYDSRRGVVLMHGGVGPGVIYDDLWEWSGSSWSERVTVGSARPSGRSLHNLAFDDESGTLLLFGGVDSLDSVLGDTWELDGWTWTERTPISAGGGPAGRALHGMAYDAERDVTVLYGGTPDGEVSNTSLLNQVWEYDDGAWSASDVTPAPTLLAHADLAFNGEQIVALMTTIEPLGIACSQPYVQDAAQRLISWDGASLGAPSQPSTTACGRVTAGFARHRESNELMMLGGSDGLIGIREAVIYKQGWRRLEPGDGDRPSRRANASLAADSTRGYAVLFGGGRLYDPTQADPITWLFDGSSWRGLLPDMRPRARQGAGLVFENLSSRVILFGGHGAFENNTPPAPLNDTWQLVDGRWSELSPATPPPPRALAGVAWHAADDVVVLFGGQTQLAPPDTSVTLYDDTWTFSPTTEEWTPLSPSTSPPARSAPVMVYDERRQAVLLFGGRGDGGLLADHWSFDDGDWSTLAPTNPPPARMSAAAAWDDARQRVVVYGGLGDDGPLDDFWQLDSDSGTWETPPDVPLKPPSLVGGAMAYDRRSKKTTLFGGSVAGTTELDLHMERLSPGDVRQPSLVALAHPTRGLVAPAWIDGISVRARCGGNLQTGGTGAGLYVWGTGAPVDDTGSPLAAGAWKRVASNSDPEDAIGDFMGWQAEPGTAKAYVLDAPGVIGAACRSPRLDLPAVAVVGAEEMEVRVRYSVASALSPGG
jgi:hypothetical protein